MSDFECLRRKRNAYLDSAIKRGRIKDNYQDEETQADPKHGRKMIKKLRDEMGIEDRIPADAPEYEDVFEELLSDDRGGAILYFDHLDKLTEMVEIAERETAERRASCELIMQKVFDTYYKPDVDLDLRRNVTGAFLEYNYSVELICRKLSYIRTACMYYGVWLVKEIPVDRIIAEKIKESLGSTVEVYDDRMPLSQIPGFFVPWDGEPSYMELDPNDSDERWKDYESIMEGIGEIRYYILRHPQQIDVQCLMSVVTGTEGLAEISERAFALDRAIDDYSITEEGRNLDGKSWRKLFDGWIMVKAFARVTRLILEFVDDYKDKTVGAATDALTKILPSISYALVQRSCRIALRQMLLEGSIYEFDLSQVKLTGALKKASEQVRSVRLSDVPDRTMSELSVMIKNDRRIIPYSDDYPGEDISKKYSHVCLRDGKPCGAVFVSEADEVLVLDLAYTLDNTAMAALICGLYEAALDELGNGQKVCVPVLSDRSAILVEKLVPGVGRQRSIKAQKQ